MIGNGIQRLRISKTVTWNNLSRSSRFALRNYLYQSTVECLPVLRPPFLAFDKTSKMSSLSGIDRKAMEEERLARLAKKRSATGCEDFEGLPKKTPKLVIREDREEVEQKPPETTPPLLHEDLQDSKGLEFPYGVIKKTWVFGHERQNDIKIEEILQKNDLRTAVISSFQWDFEWFATKVDPQTKLIFVMHASNDKEVYQSAFTHK